MALTLRGDFVQRSKLFEIRQRLSTMLGEKMFGESRFSFASGRMEQVPFEL